MENVIVTGSDVLDRKEDLGFDETLSHIQEHFNRSVKLSPKLFVVDISGDAVWAKFQDSLRELAGEAAAQHLNCHACEYVVRSIGNVVSVSEAGATVPVMWPFYLDDTILGRVYENVFEYVASAKIASVWMSDVDQIGEPTTVSSAGKVWTHFHAALPPHAVVDENSVSNAYQIMAISKERFRILTNEDTGIHRIKLDTINTVVKLLEADELYRSDRFLAPAKFHQSLKQAFTDKTINSALIWRTLVSAPNGWENVNSTMIGQLYDMIQHATAMDEIKRWWNSSMDPSRFQRAQSRPSDAELERAEVIIEKLGAKLSLARRFATIEDLRLIWSPKKEEPSDTTRSEGVFSKLKSDRSSVSLADKYVLSPKQIDWAKFCETVLPTADCIEMKIPDAGGFAATLSATHADAPPILSWDKEDDRYPVSWYTYKDAIPALHWKLTPSSFTKINGVSKLPGHENLFLLVIDGCMDPNTKQGLGLFSESLRSEFHEIRKTIEAYSGEGQIDRVTEGSACGWLLGRNSCGMTLRVTTGKEKRDYIIDRFD